MAEVTYHRTGQHLRTLFGILLKQPDGMAARDALAELEKQSKLTPYEAGNFDSGGRRFEKIVRFATVDCVKAGWLLKQKGRWSLTAEGRDALIKHKDPEEFYRTAATLYRTWKKSQPGEDAAEAAPEAETMAKAASVTFEEAEESAWDEVKQFVGAMNPYDFQDLVGALLRALGYFILWTAPPGKDGGVDIVAAPDALGTQPPRIKVQVKRQVAAINVDGLRSFMATLGLDEVGLFVSMGGFTKDAQEEARMQATRKVTLIDLERLFDLWVDHLPKMPDEDRRRLPLQPVYFLAPE